MRAEDQRMLVADAQGQQTVQCLFIQPGKRQQAKIHNIEFEKNPEGLYAYVYSGTFEGFLAFKQIMEQHGVFPAHEIPGGEPTAETDEPTVNTDSGKTDTDTLTNPVEIEADANALHGAEPADNRQSATVEAGQAPAEPGSDNAAGSGPDDASGGDQGGTPATGNGAGSVGEKVAKPKTAGKAKTEPDPFEL